MSEMCDGTPTERYTIVPSAGGGWAAVAGALARKVASLPDDGRWWYLILEADVPGEPYVQLAASRRSLLAEVRSDEFRFDGPALDEAVIEAMRAAGWREPDGSIDDQATWHPHWWQTFDAPYDIRAVCEQVVLWFATGFDLDEDGPTTLQVFPGDVADDDDDPMIVNA